ncbi:MAG: hypothetical protein AAF226_12585, partial [Verrucomicrobiota bacterium]
LMTYYHGTRNKALYFRLTDNDTGEVYRTFTLGDYLQLRPPQKKIDSDNQLHVLHMSGPNQYRYTVINIEGRAIIQKPLFEGKNGNRPTLVSNSFNDVTVQGGMTQEEAETPYEQREFRNISERPPGIPRL